MTQTSAVTERAISLLGQGIDPAIVAATTGVTVSRISQLLSNTEISEQVAELRFKNLSAQTERDNRYDALEDKLVDKLEEQFYAISSPALTAKILSIVSAIKRRGAVVPVPTDKPAQVVNLQMPAVVMNQFITNIDKQVIQVGQQPLITVQSASMHDLLKASRAEPIPVLTHEIPNPERVP